MKAPSEAEQSAALTDFFAEMIRVCRADSRLLSDPIVAPFVQQARAFGHRQFLKMLPGDYEKGVKRAWSPRQILLWSEIEKRRRPEDGSRPASMAKIQRVLAEKGYIRKNLTPEGFRKMWLALDHP